MPQISQDFAPLKLSIRRISILRLKLEISSYNTDEWIRSQLEESQFWDWNTGYTLTSPNNVTLSIRRISILRLKLHLRSIFNSTSKPLSIRRISILRLKPVKNEITSPKHYELSIRRISILRLKLAMPHAFQYHWCLSIRRISILRLKRVL